MNFKNLISTLVISMLVFNCSSGGDDNEPDPDPIPETVSYNSHVRPIISGNCISCHAATPTNGAPTSYTTYDQVKAGVEGNIIFRINSSTDPMPPTGRMSANNIAIIQKW